VKVLGISGLHGEAAAAVAVDGRVVAAVSEDAFTRVPGIGYAHTGGLPKAAVEACLARAGLRSADLDAVAVAGDDVLTGERSLAAAFGDLPIRPVDALHADAVQAAVSARSDGPVLVCSPDQQTMALFAQHGGHIDGGRSISGDRDLMSAARLLSRTLGVSDRDPCRVLDRLSNGSDAEFVGEMRTVISWDEGAGITVDEPALATFVESLGDGLNDATTLNIHVQQRRRAAAASFTCRVAEVLRDAFEDIRAGAHAPVSVGGSLFSHPRLNTELRRLVGDELTLPAVPEPAGRALGAALAVATPADPVPSVALGPAFSDAEIKRTLDGCRLEYVYEPDRRRVLPRVSRMLSQGKVIAWFQGPMAFGPRPMGARSVLCDPSTRYARHNINEYLREVPFDEPLPVVFAPSAAVRCLAGAASSPFVVMDAQVGTEWRQQLASALDWRQHVRVHAPQAQHGVELCELLEYHYARTAIPGLIETNLCGPGEPVACTPRDAVRTVYSSAIDALIIGNFILMKDYWLLQAHVD
jgi:carbamoyltransferase